MLAKTNGPSLIPSLFSRFVKAFLVPHFKDPNSSTLNGVKLPFNRYQIAHLNFKNLTSVNTNVLAF